MSELRCVDRAEDLPHHWWPEHAGDPRRTRAWAVASRWPGDGAGFLAAEDVRGGPAFAAVRRVSQDSGWQRMNAVDVCAGAGRDVPADDRLTADARAATGDQLNLTLMGYATPVWGQPEQLATFLRAAASLAAAEGAHPAVLHIAAGSPVLEALANLGWAVGVTDLYPVFSSLGTGLEEFLTARQSKQRVNIRREYRRLAEGGGRVEIVRGAELARYHDVIAALEAESDSRHGITVPPDQLRAMNERLLAAFGDDLSAALVRDASGEVVASCTLVAAGRAVLPRFAGFSAERARPLAAYFHAAYYAGLTVAWERGATEVLLGPGSLTPKLLRGAELRPVYSAVPRTVGALTELLAQTDRVLRAQAQRAGQPVPS